MFSLVIFGYLFLGSIKLVFENYRVNQETSRLSADVASLEQRNSDLRNLLAYYRTDSYKEKEARARLNFQKPGERVVAVPLAAGDDGTSIAQPGIETKDPTPPSNPRQWWEYFFAKRGAA